MKKGIHNYNNFRVSVHPPQLTCFYTCHCNQVIQPPIGSHYTVNGVHQLNTHQNEIAFCLHNTYKIVSQCVRSAVSPSIGTDLQSDISATRDSIILFRVRKSQDFRFSWKAHWTLVITLSISRQHGQHCINKPSCYVMLDNEHTNLSDSREHIHK